jgi:hypothetical protein
MDLREHGRQLRLCRVVYSRTCWDEWYNASEFEERHIESRAHHEIVKLMPVFVVQLQSTVSCDITEKYHTL